MARMHPSGLGCVPYCVHYWPRLRGHCVHYQGAPFGVANNGPVIHTTGPVGLRTYSVRPLCAMARYWPTCGHCVHPICALPAPPGWRPRLGGKVRLGAVGSSAQGVLRGDPTPSKSIRAQTRGRRTDEPAEGEGSQARPPWGRNRKKERGGRRPRAEERGRRRSDEEERGKNRPILGRIQLPPRGGGSSTDDGRWRLLRSQIAFDEAVGCSRRLGCTRRCFFHSG